ncbi:uncharacterized protein LOC128214378 [Mya arenaria]|uniref:uncharacterized protein LOC128214378 n=1 Tax=Mya arenaria TaxID=6604 RepID=UPI0022E2D56B|nr:uncharacterized protein LOC128214378 [Mya arenaria]
MDTKEDLLAGETSSDESDEESTELDFPRAHQTSLLLAIRAAVDQEDDVIDYVRHSLLMCRRSSTAVVCRTLLTVLAIISFVIGVVRYGECPYEQELPLFLVLHGAAMVARTSLHIANVCYTTRPDDTERNTLTTLNDVISVFVVLWTLTGSVWTFGIFQYVDMTDMDNSEYCDLLVFMCACALLAVLYTLFLLFVILVAGLMIYFTVHKSHRSSQLPFHRGTSR